MSQNYQPHIAHILGSPSTGGAQNMVLDMIKSRTLSEFQHSVIFCFATGSNEWKRFEKAGANVKFCLLDWPQSTPVPSYRFNKWVRRKLRFSYTFRLAALLRSLSIDIVHSHLDSGVEQQAIAALIKVQTSWIFTIHGLLLPELADQGIPQKIAQLIRDAPASVVGVSQAALASWSTRGSFKQDKLHVIFNGVDRNRFKSGLPRQIEWRRQRNIPQESVLFGSAGRLVPDKNYELFIEAAAAVVKQNANVVFVIAGDGSSRELLGGKIIEHKLEKHFQLIGDQSDVVPFMNEIDVFVLSSRTEAFPLVLLEACAMGIPCIATDVGGIPEILGQNGGMLIPPNNAEKLADAMLAMLNPQTRQTYAQRSLAIAAKFPLEQTVTMYRNLYRALIDLPAPVSKKTAIFNHNHEQT